MSDTRTVSFSFSSILPGLVGWPQGQTQKKRGKTEKKDEEVDEEQPLEGWEKKWSCKDGLGKDRAIKDTDHYYQCPGLK